MRAFAISDVRALMPAGRGVRKVRNPGDIVGIAVHHSGNVNVVTGLSMGTARSVFDYHVNTLGWDRGGYNYFVRPNGVVEYALDESVPALHAGLRVRGGDLDPEGGQHWNNHYLAVCLLGWFERDRSLRSASGQIIRIPDMFTRPLPAQMRSLGALVRHLQRRYGIPAENVRGHRELAGTRTRCPGANVDLPALRQTLAEPAPPEIA